MRKLKDFSPAVSSILTKKSDAKSLRSRALRN
jgi:hypothetical protein